MIFKWPYFKLSQLWNWEFFWKDDFGILSWLWYVIWDWWTVGGTQWLWSFYSQSDYGWFASIIIWCIVVFCIAVNWMVFICALSCWLAIAFLWYFLKFVICLLCPLIWNLIALVFAIIWWAIVWLGKIFRAIFLFFWPSIAWIVKVCWYAIKGIVTIVMVVLIPPALVAEGLAWLQAHPKIHEIFYILAWEAYTAILVATLPLGWFFAYMAFTIYWFIAEAGKAATSQTKTVN